MEAVNLDFGLAVDAKKTASRCTYFLKVKFEQYLNLTGMHRNQLSSATLSAAPGGTNLNGVESQFLSETDHSIKIQDPAKKAVSAIYKAMDNCTQTSMRPYRTILIGYFVQNLDNYQIAERTHLSLRTINNKKVNALCEFAERFEYWKKFYGVEYLPDLRVFRKND